MTHASDNEPCMLCNACRDDRRRKVLHLTGEGGTPLCKSKRTEYPLVEGRFEVWVDAGNRCKACARMVAKNLDPDWEKKRRR